MANKFGGFGGGANIQQLMKQAQAMQSKVGEVQQELEETEVTGHAGGDMVAVTMNCKKVISAIKISPKAVDPDDVEMLEDLIIAAINDANSQADEITEEKMAPFAGIGGML